MLNQENEQYSNHLQELGGSDYEIVDGEPNIKGWDVKDTAGQTIGQVDELLFDPESRKVRYLVVDFDNEFLTSDDNRKTLVPIGIATLKDDDEEVILPNINAASLKELPAYEKGTLTPEHESTIRRVFEGGSTPLETAADNEYNKESFYTHEHFNEDNFFNRPSSTTGSITPSSIEDNTTNRQESGNGFEGRSRIILRNDNLKSNDQEEKLLPPADDSL
jgi:sporulation protein YlmC with PRC-barrel domain